MKITQQTHESFIVGQSAANQTPAPLGSAPVRRALKIKAALTNSGTVYVGNATDEGWPLAAGERLEIPIDDLAKVVLRASEDGQVVEWIAV